MLKFKFNFDWCLLLAIALVPASCINAQLNRRLPDEAEGVTVEYHIGDYVPFDVPFTDQDSNYVSLAEYFDGKRPVILTFNYSNCPSMCHVQLEELALCLNKIDFELGQDYQVVSISIDPLEQVSRAREFRRKFIRMIDAEPSNKGWSVLVGDQRDVSKVADTVGFKYKYLPRRKEYSHPAVAIMCAPDGKIVRYIHGLNFEPETIRRALIESADGKIGSPINQLTAACFFYDEYTGKYTFAAMRVMRWVAGLTVVALVVTLTPYWFFAKGIRMSKASHDVKGDDAGHSQSSETELE